MVCCRYYTAGRFAEGKRLLEIGCGTGRGLGYLSARAAEVIGSDYSTENLIQARERYKDRIKLMALDAQRLPFRDNTFDVIAIMEVVQYLTQFDDFLEECRRVLKDGGTLVLCLPNKDSPGFHVSPLGRRYYSAPELFDIMKKHGFETELSGAFPSSGKALREKLRIRLIVAGGKVLNLLPGAPKIKKLLGKTVLGQHVVTKPELEDSDMAPENYNFHSIPSGSPDRMHKILYATGRSDPDNQK
jgi:SAM-dependent methyltransferase